MHKSQLIIDRKLQSLKSRDHQHVRLQVENHQSVTNVIKTLASCSGWVHARKVAVVRLEEWLQMANKMNPKPIYVRFNIYIYISLLQDVKTCRTQVVLQVLHFVINFFIKKP